MDRAQKRVTYSTTIPMVEEPVAETQEPIKEVQGKHGDDPNQLPDMEDPPLPLIPDPSDGDGSDSRSNAGGGGGGPPGGGPGSGGGGRGGGPPRGPPANPAEPPDNIDDLRVFLGLLQAVVNTLRGLQNTMNKVGTSDSSSSKARLHDPEVLDGLDP